MCIVLRRAINTRALLSCRINRMQCMHVWSSSAHATHAACKHGDRVFQLQ